MNTRKKQIWIGVSAIVFFFLCLGGIAAVAYSSGYTGEFGRVCLAMVTSPFLMEGTLFFLAMTLLFAVNGIRKNREGGDWVQLDEKGCPILPEDR